MFYQLPLNLKNYFLMNLFCACLTNFHILQYPLTDLDKKRKITTDEEENKRNTRFAEEAKAMRARMEKGMANILNFTDPSANLSCLPFPDGHENILVIIEGTTVSTLPQIPQKKRQSKKKSIDLLNKAEDPNQAIKKANVGKRESLKDLIDEERPNQTS